MRERGYPTIGNFLAEGYGYGIECLGLLMPTQRVVTWVGEHRPTFGNIVESIIRIEPIVGITSGAIAAVVYTRLSGLLDDICTDPTQGSVVIIGMSFCLRRWFSRLLDPVLSMTTRSMQPS
ncbi:MAG: Na+/proline symporter [Gammaproteobacteria bacterium]|jgi:Na+/proline symporter